MKVILSILLFFVNLSCFSQSDSVKLKENIRKLDEALLAKDSIVLKKLLDENATYGHSNGWVENKGDVVRDLMTGYLVYFKIDSRNLVFKGDRDCTSVRMEANVKGLMNYATPFELKLHILQVWRKVRGEWKLFARQSTKVL